MRETATVASFIASAMGRSKDDVRLDAEREKAEAARFTARTPVFRRGVPSGPSQDVWRSYGDALRGFLFFLYNGSRPAPAPGAFADFRPLVESWVESGELSPDALAAFDGAAR
jgi:hypothetical protein